MIISPGRSYIFVHIPKTGGTSLTRALEDRAMKDDILIGDTPKAKRRRPRLKHLTPRGRLWKHSTLADIDGIVSPEEIARMFCFALVRNPWDRAVSYYHWLQDQSFDHPAVKLAQSLPFDPFLRHPQTVDSFRAWPASRYLTDIRGRPQASLFLRLEHFDTDKQALEDHLGFALDLPHDNRSTRRADYQSYYTRDLAQHWQAVCQPDIDRFGYRFQDESVSG